MNCAAGVADGDGDGDGDVDGNGIVCSQNKMQRELSLVKPAGSMQHAACSVQRAACGKHSKLKTACSSPTTSRHLSLPAKPT